MTNAEILGNRLFELRKEASLSQEEFADKIGVSRQAVSKWERGEALPDTDNLINIAKLFKVSLDNLILNEITSESCTEDAPQAESEETAVLEESNDNDQEENSTDDVKVIVKPFQINIIQDEKEKEEYYSFNETPTTKKRKFLRLLHNLPYPILVTVAYLLWGFLASDNSGWQIGWTLFITVPIYYSIIDCFRIKKLSAFYYPVLVTFIYCLIGMAWGMWHPYWVLFITIPIYYKIAEAIDK